MSEHSINKYCPRSGKSVAADSLAAYRENVVGFCNPHCRDDFQSNVADRPKDTIYFDAVICEMKLNGGAHVGNANSVVEPAAGSSADDFDFLVGKWNVHNRKLNTRLNACTEWTEFEATLEMQKILNGIGNFETFKATLDGRPFGGMALRLFDPKTDLWSIYWADSNAGVLDKDPVVGSFEGDLGRFFAKDQFNGTKITVVYQWDKSDQQKPVWSQAFSTDDGKTWEWNWYMHLTKGEKK
ncbi:MAG: hypothetical protein ABIU09_11200 [Pyrinomonadaceae bacterium]